MGTLWSAFDLPVGHRITLKVRQAVAAVARGAVILEKHLTLDRNLPGPDHAASSEPSEFAQLVQSVREVQAAPRVRSRRPHLASCQTVRQCEKECTQPETLQPGR